MVSSQEIANVSLIPSCPSVSLWNHREDVMPFHSNHFNTDNQRAKLLPRAVSSTLPFSTNIVEVLTRVAVDERISHQPRWARTLGAMIASGAHRTGRARVRSLARVHTGPVDAHLARGTLVVTRAPG